MDIDWTESMEQSFEYYEIDPNTWKDKKRIDIIKTCSITRDSEAITCGSASFEAAEIFGEIYVRIYLVVRQNGNDFRIPLGVYIIQTPSSEFNGKISTISMDAYTPLLELKEKIPALGYTILKNENIMNIAYNLVRENCRAPVVKTESNKILESNFVAQPENTWLAYLTDLINKAKFSFDISDDGKIIFSPIQSVDELQPKWTFTDDNSSILHPEISLKHDIYGIPNVIEVSYTIGTTVLYSRVVNDDESSPTSIQARGREIVYRETSPSLPGYPTQEIIDEYAENLLKQFNSVTYEISYTHGYCPVRVGDGVRLNYEKAGLKNIKAKVIRQQIKCTAGCEVSETAVFTKKLWK
jgi:hypothetical protein